LHHTGPSTQCALADALKVTPRSVTGLVDGPAQAGYVARRATLVTLTEHGAQKLEAMDAAHRELAELLFAGMPEARYAASVGGVEHVVARLREALR
jgi:DNA-binding MarR family transcriptional regulator